MVSAIQIYHYYTCADGLLSRNPGSNPQKSQNFHLMMGYSFSDLFIFQCFCVSFVDCYAFGVKSILCTRFGYIIGTQTRGWLSSRRIWGKYSSLVLLSASTRLFSSLIYTSSLLKRDFKKFIWLVVGHWHNNGL